MKELEPKPIKCVFGTAKCTPDIKPYGYVETPHIKAFDICNFHIAQFEEAFRPFQPKSIRR